MAERDNEINIVRLHAEIQLWWVKVVDLQLARVQMEQLVSGHSSSVIRAQRRQSRGAERKVLHQ